MQIKSKMQTDPTAYTVHPTAILEGDVVIEPGVSIGPYAHIRGPVIIGSGTVIGSHARLDGPLILGRANQIHSFAFLGCDPQDKKYSSEQVHLEVADHNIFREFCTISRGTIQGIGKTRIGSHNLFMAYVHIAHDCVVGDHNIFSNGSSLAGHVEVGNYCGLGGFSGVHQFCRIGDYSFSGGGSIITKDVPPYMIISGHPAKLFGLNLEGLRRHHFSEEEKHELKAAFKKIFRQSDCVHMTAQQFLDDPDCSLKTKFLARFLLDTKRGIVR